MSNVVERSNRIKACSVVCSISSRPREFEIVIGGYENRIAFRKLELVLESTLKI